MPANKDNLRLPEDGWYIRRGLTPPERVGHDLVPDDIKDRVKSVNPRNWRAEGNLLIADTDVGELKQPFDPAYLFTGTDKKGLPTFRKL